MANKTLFKTLVGKLIPETNARNSEGAPAYALTPKHALAQMAATGCLNATFYASAEEQLETILTLSRKVEPAFVAKTAVYARQKGYLKDTPALLLADLSTRDAELFKRAFPRVVDNGRMLRNVVQIVRSGAVGRKSLGSLPKRMVKEWLDARSDDGLFRDSVGNAPSLADVIKMVHPRSARPGRAALYGYLIGKEVEKEKLPALVKEFEAWKRRETTSLPDVPFQMLTAADLGALDWVEIARRASWQTTRMNLATFARHGVFDVKGMDREIAAKLTDETAIAKAKAFPYQLLVAFHSAGANVPNAVRNALQDAMEIALRNVPAVDGDVVVCPDVSGSMSFPATGYRKGSTSKVRCIDVAALVAAAVVRKNPSARVLPFEQKVVSIDLNGRDSVMTNAAKLAAIGGGGTATSAPLAKLNKEKAHANLVIYVSDNESWVDAGSGRGTAMMKEWNVFQNRNPKARLVCVDITPNTTTQVVEREDVLNVGGFSDEVFSLVAAFAKDGLDAGRFVKAIEKIEV